MTNYVKLPLEAIHAKVCEDYGINVSGVDEAENHLRSLLDIYPVDHKKLAAAMLCLGWQYRCAFRHDEADHMYLQSLKHSRENAFDQNRGTSRAFWFLAENHMMHVNFDLGRSLFWRAVKDFSASTGLFDEEAQACLAEFRDLAEGIARDDSLAGDVEDIIDFTAFLEEMGCDGHVTVVAA